MKVLFASSSSGSRGGGELFLLFLAEALRQRGHEVVLWVAAHERMDELCEKFIGLGPVHRSAYRNTYDYRTRLLATCWNRATSGRIADQWRGIKPDVLHVNKQNLEDGLDLLQAVRYSGLPSICTVHITQTAHFLKARAWFIRDYLSRRALSRYHGIYATVHDSRTADLSRFLHGSRTDIFTVPNGVRVQNPDLLRSLRTAKRAELGLQDSDRLVVGLGRMTPQKRPDRWLNLADDIHQRAPHTQFLWVGDGIWADEWDRTVAKRKISEFVRRLPWQAETLPFLAAGDLFLHTAEFEGLPFALIEAMAARLPCAMPTELAGELCLQGRPGILLHDNLPDVFAALQNPHRLGELSQGAANLAQECFSVDRMAEQYEKLYLRAVESQRASGLS